MLTKFNEICFADEITPWWNPSDEIIASQWLLFQRKSRLDWVDSNHRPHAYQACALTTWATIQYRAGSFPLSLPLWVWRWWDSNPWPPACRAGALPTELHPHIWVKSDEWRVNSFGWNLNKFKFLPFLLSLIFSLFSLSRFFPSSLFQKIPQNWTMIQRLLSLIHT